MKEIEKEGVIINQKDHPDIYEWLSKNVYDYKEFKKYFTLTSEGKINAYCDVDFRSCLTEFKYPFGCVNGHFSCNGCTDLTSLINSPEKIVGSFDCSGSHSLTSLIGAPEEIVGFFHSYNCKNLTSLIGSPKKIEGWFNCGNCYRLTSLIGAPEEIEGFECSNCKSLTCFIGLPKHIKNYKYNLDIGLCYNFSNDPKYKQKYKFYLAMWLELLESVNNEERKEYITNYKDKTDSYKRPIIPIEILKEYGF